MAKRKLHAFPNGLGYKLHTSHGTWDLWKPDPDDNGRDYWIANFVSTGDTAVTRHGSGPDYAAAIMNAREIV